MKICDFRRVRISGVSCAVPKQARLIYEHAQFPPKEIRAVSRMTGVLSTRVAHDNICTSDLCVEAANRLLEGLEWSRSSVEVLIFVTQTGDYLMPSTGCMLQDRLKLSSEAAAFDVNMACSGYVYGLWLAFSLIASGAARRALLLAGDTCSKFVSPMDRATALLFGDAGTATALEYDPVASDSHFIMGTDGRGATSLFIPAGGFRKRPSATTRERHPQTDGSLRSEEDLSMDGIAVASFSIQVVPKVVNRIMDGTGAKIADVDAFVFHQASKFIVVQIARKLGIPLEKVPMCLERFGNTSSASLPLTVVSEIGKEVSSRPLKVLLAGFGAGFSWGVALLSIGPIICPDIVEIPEQGA